MPDQEKIKSLEGQEAVAKAEYDQAAAQLKQIIGDVEPSGLEVQERPWPDATVLHRPGEQASMLHSGV